MHVGKYYPMAFNAQRMARNHVQAALPRRMRCKWFSIVEPHFAALANLEGVSNIGEETDDGQGFIYEFTWDEMPTAKLTCTHELSTAVITPGTYDTLRDTFRFALYDDDLLYGRNVRQVSAQGTLYFGAGPNFGLGMPLDWTDLLDEDLFKTATLIFMAAEWSDSPEFTPYVTRP